MNATKTYTVVTAAEVNDFIIAEVMITGIGPVFRTRESVTGRPVTVTAAEMMRGITNAETIGTSIRESVNHAGQTVFEIHNGESVYARYTAI